ncbi:MAG: HNH endonuclease [Puniceicoccales bacterium]|jgi:hypothetical protein|nr:HNH endonuclease [Puniceicoccales bacterium]
MAKGALQGPKPEMPSATKVVKPSSVAVREVELAGTGTKVKVPVKEPLAQTEVSAARGTAGEKSKPQAPRIEKQLTREELAKQAPHLDKAPYTPRTAESMLKTNNSGAEITSTTLPKESHPNVKSAGTRHPESGIVFDNRGFPIFDKYVKYETRISGNLKNMTSEGHMRAATRQLRGDIKAGIVDKNMFTEAQLKDIMSGKDTIKDYTWHHHQDVGRMQLVPENIHEDVRHVGGFKMWGGKK